MKQHITEKQLKEFLEIKSKDNFNKDKYNKLYKLTCPNAVAHDYFTIGKTIEILSAFWKEISIDNDTDNNGKWCVICDTDEGMLSTDPQVYYSENLVDALWKATIDTL